MARCRRYRWVLATLALIVAIVLFRRALLELPAELLDVGREPVAADLIYLLNGSIANRPFVAADLFRQGYAPRIVLARTSESAASKLGVYPNEADAAVRLLETLGVPDTAIVLLEAEVTSTSDEAAELRDHLSRSPADRVLVVTSTYHTRRSRWLMRRHLRGMPVEISMVGAPETSFDSSNWWRSESGMLAYLEEYLKFGHNLIYRRPDHTD